MLLLYFISRPHEEEEKSVVYNCWVGCPLCAEGRGNWSWRWSRLADIGVDSARRSARDLESASQH